MLICNVSLQARRTVAADMAEAAAADDASTTGNIVFAALVDDPASVADHIDAYLGQIMREAASAADSISAGSIYSTAIVEAGSAAHAQDATLAGGAVAREGMLPGVFINSSTTSRQANSAGVMVNL